MRGMGPNLAAQPFANERPVRRTTLIVWILALTLMAINIFLYQRHLSAHYGQRQTVRDLQEQIGAEREAIGQSEADLAALELGQQNQRVVFLNGQIARRTFSWSHLFDRLEEVLPANVDLYRVSPRILKQQPRNRRVREYDTDALVAIELGGNAQTVEEVLELVDRLFEHRSFTLPNLLGEREQDDGRYDFSLTVLYLPATIDREGTEVPAGQVEEAVSTPELPGGEG